jgi:DNA-binding NarL/FixJ family response regulator
MKSGTANEFTLLLATSRPAVTSLFESIGVSLHVFSLAEERPTDAQVAAANAAVVDVDLDVSTAFEFCRALGERCPDLPIAILLCCPQCITPWELRSLLAAGVRSVLDLRSTTDEVWRTLMSLGHGRAVIQLQLGRGQRTLFRDVFLGRSPRRESRSDLLELVAQGLPDHEIGRRLHLSPHTVKHQIERLRREVGARNRTELAAWAGCHGLYTP